MRKKLFKLLPVCICCALLCSCNSSNNNVMIINLADAVNNNVEVINLSKIAKSIKYIPLETREDALIGDIPRLAYDGKYILVADVTPATINVFDKDGKFVRRINRMGRGPEEYMSINNISFLNGNIAIATGSDIIEYDIMGNFVRRITAPEIDGYSTFFSVAISENRYISSLTNTKESMEYYAVVYDSLQNIHRMVATDSDFKESYLGTTDFQEPIRPAMIFLYSDACRIFYPESKAIASLDKFNVIDTAYVIDYGSFQVPGGMLANASASSRHISPMGFVESKDYLFMSMATRAVFSGTFRSYFLYDKRTMKTSVVYDDTENRRGFKDDIAGGIEFWPHIAFGERTLLSSIDAISLIEYPYSNISKELNDIVSSLKEDSNPVVMIVELK